MKYGNIRDIEPNINPTSLTLLICRIISEYALLSVEPLGFFVGCLLIFFCLFDCLFVVFVSVGFYAFSFFVMVRREIKYCSC